MKPDDDSEEIGSTFLALRSARGWTQQQMAERAGVSLSAYCRHESGKETPSFRLVARYARELGLLLPEFFRVHEEIQKSARRCAQGAGWWRNLDQTLAEESARFLDRRRAADEFAAAANRLVEALYKSIGSH